jgi:undecaprenyl pyrophosphate synthase
MSDLFYPTIDLFVYDLKNALNSDREEISINTEKFKNKLSKEVQLNDLERETEYLELAAPQKKPKLNPVNTSLEGYYYPVRLNDVYGLQIDCSVNNLTEPQLVDSFAAIKTELEEKHFITPPLTIGQTWLVSGWLTDNCQQEPEVIAKSCYEVLFKNKNWEQHLYSQGTFLKGKFFELWQPQNVSNDHVIIALFPNREMAEKAGKFYPDWMGLFCYRHKITWAYHQSRFLKKALNTHYQKIDENTKILQYSDQNLNSLRKVFNNIQDIINQYTTDLLNLSFQKQTIDINLVNYQTRLEFIKKQLEEESDLEGLDKFSNLVKNKYLVQLDKDTENMQLGLRLLENNINAIRSRLELDKAEREKTFQTLVTIVGGGIAVAKLVDTKGDQCRTLLTPKYASICEKPYVGSVITPIVVILIFGVILWWLTKFLKKI